MIFVHGNFITIASDLGLRVFRSGASARGQPRLRGVVRARAVPARVPSGRPPGAAEARGRVPALQQRGGRQRRAPLDLRRVLETHVAASETEESPPKVVRPHALEFRTRRLLRRCRPLGRMIRHSIFTLW